MVSHEIAGRKASEVGAIEAWNERVKTHHAQSEAVMAAAGWSDDDFWQPYARFFRLDPRRTDDPVLDLLLPMIEPDDTVLDVGGGAGRLALPMALRCKHVTVVEPSNSMIEQLRESADESGIENYSVTRALWDVADVKGADVVLCAHVVYGVADIEPFIRKLEAHADSLVVLLAFVESPMNRISRFWKPVHGEERIDMPALPELVSVLWDMGIYPDVQMLAPVMPDRFEDRDVALTQLRNRLYVKAGSAEDERLRSAMEDFLEDTEGGVMVRDIRPVRQGFISWRPERNG